FLILRLGRASGDNVCRNIRLELDQVCASRCRRSNQLFGQHHVTVMVNPGLSNNKRLHFILFAGTPAYTALGSQSRVTTAPEPTMVFSPTTRFSALVP